MGISVYLPLGCKQAWFEGESSSRRLSVGGDSWGVGLAWSQSPLRSGPVPASKAPGNVACASSQVLYATFRLMVRSQRHYRHLSTAGRVRRREFLRTLPPHSAPQCHAGSPALLDHLHLHLHPHLRLHLHPHLRHQRTYAPRPLTRSFHPSCTEAPVSFTRYKITLSNTSEVWSLECFGQLTLYVWRHSCEHDVSVI